MNNDKSRFESGSIKGKMREILSISLFTLIAMLMAVVLADLIFFPLAYYSVRNVDIFNIVFKYTGILFISVLMITLLFLKVRKLHRDGKSIKSIMVYVLMRPVQYLGFSTFVLLLITLLIAIIYFIFSSNYYHLHRIAGGA
jgi:hypothetical protein